MRLPSLAGLLRSISSVTRSVARLLALACLAAVFLVLLAPGCGRSSLEVETYEAGTVPQPQTCGPSTCPNGCCDATGVCRTGADTRACGTAGQRCSDCIANGFQFCDARKVCGRNVTSCGPDECPGGCCRTEGGTSRCLAGTDASACGRSGSTCIDCQQDGRSCDTVTRTCGTGKCDATNCAGCCVGDQCLMGTASSACGVKGQTCTSCAATGRTCLPSAGGGGTCEGAPTCGPANCGGCCDGNTCVGGSDSIACGKQGQACTNCAATGRTCVPLGQPDERTCQTPVTCNAANCPGCCVGNACVVATTPAACGKSGEVCKACGANESCTSGVCVPAPNCGPANCAGCCIGADVCAVGGQDTACGLGGGQCINCVGQGRVCQGGACEAPACGPANCAGCCSGNTCVLGTQDSACGQAGAQCNDCTPGGQVCQARQCQAKCGPANCVGCCTTGNACSVGFTNTACGSAGAACSNCTAAGSTCNTLSVPRVCANQANQCPAPYAACPAGVTTGVTAPFQGVCDDAIDLDSLQVACAGGPETGTCQAAFAVLQAENEACSACLTPFRVPFAQRLGIYRCVAPFVSNACNRSTGCAIDCQDTSCTNCPAATADQCRTEVNGGGGQCNAFFAPTVCDLPALGGGSLCSPLTYGGNFGGWFRAVGDHFCGNGP